MEVKLILFSGLALKSFFKKIKSMIYSEKNLFFFFFILLWKIRTPRGKQPSRVYFVKSGAPQSRHTITVQYKCIYVSEAFAINCNRRSNIKCGLIKQTDLLLDDTLSLCSWVQSVRVPWQHHRTGGRRRSVVSLTRMLFAFAPSLMVEIMWLLDAPLLSL